MHPCMYISYNIYIYVCVYVCVMKTTPETWRHRIGPWSSWEGTVELCPPNSCGWSKLKKYLKFGELTGSQHTLKKVANTEHWDACFFVQGQKDFGQCTNDNNPLPSSGISTRKLPFGNFQSPRSSTNAARPPEEKHPWQQLRMMHLYQDRVNREWDWNTAVLFYV